MFSRLTELVLGKLEEWSKERSVTLRLRAQEKCTLVREASRKVEDPTTYVKEESTFGEFYFSASLLARSLYRRLVSDALYVFGRMLVVVLKVCRSEVDYDA